VLALIRDQLNHRLRPDAAEEALRPRAAAAARIAAVNEGHDAAVRTGILDHLPLCID
jgi:hypothetical protein